MPALFPNYNGKVLTRNGEDNYIPFIALAHELAHALSYIEGNNEMGIWRIIFGQGKNIVVNRDEIFASHWENKIRAENNLPLRTHYLNETGNVTLLIDSSGRSLHVDIFDVPFYMPNHDRRFIYKY